MTDKPVTREEKYLAYLTGDYTGEISKPITRKEKYLYELCLKGMGGEISPEEIKAAVNEYLEKNPVKPGATTEQAQQIEQNKTDIASLKTETGSLKEDLVKLSLNNDVLPSIPKIEGYYLNDDGVLTENTLVNCTDFFEIPYHVNKINVLNEWINSIGEDVSLSSINLIFLYDENKNLVHSYGKSDVKGDFSVKIPYGVKYVRINYIVRAYQGQILEYYLKLSISKTNIYDIVDYEDITDYVNLGHYINTQGATVGNAIDLTPSDHYDFGYAVISCSYGDIFKITSLSTEVALPYVFLDSTNKVLSISKTTSVVNRNIVAPIGASKLVYNIRYMNAADIDFFLYKKIRNLKDVYIESDYDVISTNSPDITDFVATSKNITLGNGVYTCHSVVMGDNCVIKGAGKSTIIYFLDDSGEMLTAGNMCTISNCSLYGTDNEQTYDVPTVAGNKVGIYVDNVKEFVCDNVIVRYFDNAGIRVVNTVANHAFAPKFSNITAYNCYVGLLLDTRAEYNQVNNSTFSYNRYGCINSGGNNLFSNCVMNNNNTGVYLRGGSTYPNDGHGSATGCIFNHNDEYAILSDGISAGFMFIGCQAFYSAINILNSLGISISNSEIGGSMSIEVNGGQYVLFANNVIHSDINISVINNTKVEFINNRNVYGTLIQP